MVVPGTAHTSGAVLPALFGALLLFGVGLVLDPERTLLLRGEIGVSSVARSNVNVRRWRLRGCAFAVTGAALCYVTYV